MARVNFLINVTIKLIHKTLGSQERLNTGRRFGFKSEDHLLKKHAPVQHSMLCRSSIIFLVMLKKQQTLYISKAVRLQIRFQRIDGE